MKPTIPVACGVLIDADGKILLAQRPAGKIAAGYWEFPGGKIEPGESALDALRRELMEELGVRVVTAQPLIRFRHAYSNRDVVLDTWLVTCFEGMPRSLEGQALEWHSPSALAAVGQLLPTVMPILRTLQLPRHYVFTEPQPAEPSAAALSQLPSAAMLRLRWPGLDDGAYRELARRWLAPAQAVGLRVVLDRDPADVERLSADGWHGRSACLQSLPARPAVPLVIASVHTKVDLERAAQLGFDAAVLGSVFATPTHPDGMTLGWTGFTECRALSALTVYAIGGLVQADLPTALAANAQGLAGIRSYWRV